MTSLVGKLRPALPGTLSVAGLLSFTAAAWVQFGLAAGLVGIGVTFVLGGWMAER